MTRTTLRPATIADVKPRDGMLICFEAAALRQAGLEDAPALRFQAHDGQLVAVGLDEDVDGRSATHARSVDQNGRITLAPEDFEEAFGLTFKDVQKLDEDLPLLVYAGDGALVFAEIDAIEIDEDVLEEARDGRGF